LYYGTWDYSEHGCQLKAYNTAREALTEENPVGTTRLFNYRDPRPPEGRRYCALVSSSGDQRSKPTYAIARLSVSHQ